MHEVARQREQFVRSRAFRALSRAGFAARGVVYGLIGVLAIELALGAGRKSASQQGALETVVRQPFGHVLLFVIAVGLGGYSLWRLVRASLGRGPEDAGDSVVDRVGGFGSAAVYAALCAIAVEILAGGGAAGGNVPGKTAGVLGWPGGQLLVGSAGVVLLGIAGYQGYRGVSRSFLDESKTEKMGRQLRRVVTVVGVVGHTARMVVLGLVGVFLLKASIEYRPRAAVGLGGALNRLQAQPSGSVLLAIVAAGLLAFAVYSVGEARYHRL